MVKQKIRSIQLSAEQVTHLTILLDIELRPNNLVDEYRESLNDIFKQLTGKDHHKTLAVRKWKEYLKIRELMDKPKIEKKYYD